VSSSTYLHTCSSTCVFAFPAELFPPAWDAGPWSSVSSVVRLDIEHRCAVIGIEAFHRQGPTSPTEQFDQSETDRVWSVWGSCCEDSYLLDVNASSRVNLQSVTPFWHVVKPE